VEVPPPPPVRGGATAHARQGEAAPPKKVKPPRCKVARQPVVPLRAPSVNVADACFSVKILHQAFLSLGKVAVHLGVQ
jgi:hypothetical protein